MTTTKRPGRNDAIFSDREDDVVLNCDVGDGGLEDGVVLRGPEDLVVRENVDVAAFGDDSVFSRRRDGGDAVLEGGAAADGAQLEALVDGEGEAEGNDEEGNAVEVSERGGLIAANGTNGTERF